MRLLTAVQKTGGRGPLLRQLVARGFGDPCGLALLGLSFSRVWTYAFGMVMAGWAVPGGCRPDILSLLFFGAGVCSAFACSFAPRRSPLPSWCVWAPAACSAIACALAILGSSALPGLQMPAAVLGGAALGLLRLSWGLLYSRIEGERLGACTSLSFLVAVAIVVGIKLLPAAAALPVVVVVPCGAAAALAVARRHLLGTCSDGSATPSRPPLVARQPFWPLAVGMFLFVGASTALSSGLDMEGAPAWLAEWRAPIVDGFVAALFTLLYLVLGRVDSLTVYRLVLPLMALGYVLFPLVPGEHQVIGSMVSSVGYGLFDLLSWIVMAQCAHARPGQELRVFGMGVGMTLLGRTLGMLAGSVLRDQGVQSLDFSSVSIVMLFVLLVVFLTILPDRFFASAPVPPAVGDDALTGGCRILARRERLTERETDVLVWLARGRNAASISEELGIARGTVQTHIKHIYGKTGIHTQQELMKTVEDLGCSGTE